MFNQHKGGSSAANASSRPGESSQQVDPHFLLLLPTDSMLKPGPASSSEPVDCCWMSVLVQQWFFQNAEVEGKAVSFPRGMQVSGQYSTMGYSNDTATLELHVLVLMISVWTITG